MLTMAHYAALVGATTLFISAAHIAPVFAKPVSVQSVDVPGFADLVQQVSPAVVSVRVKAKIKTSEDQNGFQLFSGPEFDFFPDDHPFKRFFREFHGEENRKGKNKKNDRGRSQERTRPISQGSGFFISEDGYVVTNNHVIQGGQEFTVILDTGKEYSARLVGTDSRTDLALLKIDSGSQKFTYLSFADDSSVRVGNWVVAVGNAFGLGGTVTAGIISARGRDIGAGPYDDFIQIDAAVNYGNSGGPAFNLKGEVVGVNTAIFSPSGGNVGIAFAIPCSTVKEVVAALKKNGAIARGWLGVKIQPLTEEISESLGLKNVLGALVSEVHNDGPGEKAGIRTGDVITAVNGKEVSSPRELARLIGSIDPGKLVEVTVWRNGKNEKIKVNLGLLPTQEKNPESSFQQNQKSLEELGLTLSGIENKEGVLVTDVDSGSIAEERGIQSGDIFITINRTRIRSIKDIIDEMQNSAKAGRKSVLLQISRKESTHFVPLPIISKEK